ncbi:MAG TPA: DUF4241 domain-containing protein [Actinophytocola sp.]|uniref:DUF4241 domain-containing protein n=1 Tax=Actinophytocola sp. TaxID=1872138 RepID=UPI002DBD140E|nr:DUF4241 domain-containing protein [Actinophytocola sp.]HEU5471268.1 DUF4241 domain-containing protein [Actinophytocola sp.]
MSENTLLRVMYCEGWDAERRAIAGRLATATARERDQRGEQYAFCVVEPDTERIGKVVEIAWQHHFARCWSLDEQGRRNRMVEYRNLDGRLFRLRSAEWTYPDDECPEFDENRCDLIRTTHAPDGKTRHLERTNGESDVRNAKEDPAGLFGEAPRFGDWAGVIEAGPGVELVAADPDVEESATPPWRPVVPMRPDQADSYFQPGQRWTLRRRNSNPVVVTEVVPAGTVRTPSGRLVAADPSLLHDGLSGFEATVAPGEYPVELAMIRFVEDPSHERVAAAKLTVSSQPVVSWEHAAEPGEDPRLLDDDKYYGFVVDTGQACFADAEARDDLSDIVNTALDDPDSPICAVWGAKAAELADPESGGSLVAFSSGWGDGMYPTWLGRTATGEVACFVTDLLILREASLTNDT